MNTYYAIFKTLFHASAVVLIGTIFLEVIAPGFVVLHVPLIWILLLVLFSGVLVAGARMR